MEGGFKTVSEIVEEVAEKIAEKRVEEVMFKCIKAIMKNLNKTAEDAMELLDIPQEQWSHYKSLL